jgi:hypothetical protein
MKALYKAIARLTGKNPKAAPKSLVLEQMNELRPLPLGMTEFDEWSDRIISGAMLTADIQSQKFALAEMITHIKPTEDHCTDAYFIKALRKVASNQVALEAMKRHRDQVKARLAKEITNDKPLPSPDNVQSINTPRATHIPHQ